MKTAFFLASFLLSASAYAQEVPPALFVEIEGKSQPLEIASVRAEVRILGPLAETRTTLTFANPHDRNLEGELYFPLPAGATVSGYALDVHGRMVDGVAVTREKARRTFEQEVRKGIDPGLVEWTRGNVFRTRIFPLPPHGTRTVMVRYVSELVESPEGSRYVLPLDFRQKVGTFSLRIETVRPPSAPTLISAQPDLSFAEWREGFLAETSKQDILLDRDLEILVPRVETPPVLVERDGRGVVRFLASVPVAVPATEAPVAPGRVSVLWDASGSRAGADLGPETAFLRGYLETVFAARPSVEVVLTVFRDRAEPDRRIVLDREGLDAFLASLAALPYDGGTGVAGLAPGAGEAAGPPPDVVLFFSDGLVTFGGRAPGVFRAPVFAVHSATSADVPFLESVARASGGRVLDLRRLPVEEAVAAVGRPVWSLRTASADDALVTGLLPATGTPAGGRFLVTGVLRGSEAEVTLGFGFGRPAESRTFRVSASGAVEGDLLRVHWAQAKLSGLLPDADRNEEEITRLGREQGLVTPFTSLLVLETIEQYLRHEILPPATFPEMREKYIEVVEGRRREEAALERSKLERIIELWRARVEWWETKFTWPENFRYRSEEPKSEEAGEGGSTGSSREGAESPRTPPMAAPGSSDAGGPGFTSGDDSPDKEKNGDEQPGSGPAIALREWDPETPYLKALKAATVEDRSRVYLDWRGKFATSPAFFVDCAEFFFREGDEPLGVRILSNLAEMKLDDAPLLRVLAHRLAQLGRLDLAVEVFEEVLRMRPEEPQSYRDLGLALGSRGSRADFERAIDLLYHVVRNQWERFDEIEVLTLMELNRLIPKATAAGVSKIPVDARLVKPLPVDIRIVMTWDADLTDMDLHVIEPSGEEAYYGHNRTTIGGLVSRDFTQGYGPEEYLVRKAMHGSYKIITSYFGSGAAKLTGAVTIHVEVTTNYGRPDEQVRMLTLRLTEAKENFLVGEIEF